MNPAPNAAPPIITPAPPTTRTLRRLFLTLYLRGRGARGLRLKSAPKSVGQKLFLALLFYVLFGMFAFYFFHQPVFALAVYLHGMTFVFLGMFVCSSSGEILFNKEEGDILLHRPVTPREMLWSKIRVLVEVSLWLAGAMNLAGLFVGLTAPDGNYLFPIVHIFSTILEALFCTSCIVLMYQLVLRWFGRERLDSIMTTTQVFVAIAVVLAGQLMPQLILRINTGGLLRFSAKTWWIALLPPAWFASLDDAIAGHGGLASWLLGALALAATAVLLWLAFVRLAHTYEEGLQTMSEVVSKPRSRSKRRWTEIFFSTPPLKWFFRTPVSRAAFQLTVAYLFRDRDVKLRVFPGLAPIIIIPFVLLFRNGNQHAAGLSGFSMAYCGGFLATLPLFALDLLQYSQQWQASDIFRVAPMNGPAELCHGARRAALFLLAIPAFLFVSLVIYLSQKNLSPLLLLLPGFIIMPVVSLVPALLRRGVPLSRPNEEARSANRSAKMVGIMALTAILSGLSAWAFSTGWFYPLLLGEVIVAIPLYFILRGFVSKLRWQPLE